MKHLSAGAVAVALVAAVVAPAAGASTPKAAAVIPAPKGLPAFYAVPTPIPGVKGKLIKLQKVAVAGLHGTMYRVMYSSLNLQNKYIAVTTQPWSSRVLASGMSDDGLSDGAQTSAMPSVP